jgi:site-specific recombinase XerD
MRQTDFARYVTDFFGQYLPVECGLSKNTVKAYSLTFTLLLEYMKKREGINPERLCLKDMTKQRVIDFLKWLEKDRRCGISTRNARLGALHTFFKYLQYRDVVGIAIWQDILSIRFKRHSGPEMSYLSIEGIRLLLRQPDLETKRGRRDLALLGLLYDSGARVQELLDLTPACIRFDELTTIRICGKGNKIRNVPLSENQVNNLKQYMTENNLSDPNNRGKPLFPNPQGYRLTRMSVLNIVKKYVGMSRTISPELMPPKIGCRSLRHSKAMHLLDAEVNLVYIRDFLGHVSTVTTEIYARASEKKMRSALAKMDPSIVKDGRTTWQKNKELLSYLKDLQQKY